ncbi:DUF4382 domain-containing protein [Labilibacter sediminis]|nr:DUF4382 domain-containing protein [Labilibacter sediminis]
MMKSKFLVIAALLLVVFASCSKDGEKGDAVFSVRLTDSPAEYEEVLIDVQEIKINLSSEDDEGGWITLSDVNTGVYDLLELTNGVDTLLAEEMLSAGTISQMRLVLGDNNQLKKDGVYHPLDTPSGQQSGLKFNIHATLEPGLTYKIWIDFDAARSIVEKGNGTYSLKPVIRTFTEATSGAIEGNIIPVESRPYIHAITAENDTFSTYADEETGYFLIRALPEDVYKIEINPQEGYEQKVIEDIDVTIGNVYSLEDVTINTK